VNPFIVSNFVITDVTSLRVIVLVEIFWRKI